MRNESMAEKQEANTQVQQHESLGGASGTEAPTDPHTVPVHPEMGLLPRYVALQREYANDEVGQRFYTWIQDWCPQRADLVREVRALSASDKAAIVRMRRLSQAEKQLVLHVHEAIAGFPYAQLEPGEISHVIAEYADALESDGLADLLFRHAEFLLYARRLGLEPEEQASSEPITPAAYAEAAGHIIRSANAAQQLDGLESSTLEEGEA
jgi:hypothetical protein